MLIAGIDEAGRGPLAGPVVAAAVILPDNFFLKGLNDSKKISPKKRESLYPLIMQQAVSYHIALADPAEIDSLNIHHATLLAMRRALEGLSIQPAFIQVDGKFLPKTSIPGKAIIGGDGSEPAISAASVLAKVYRDHLMDALDAQYPQYGFKQHKGYPTVTHIAALKKFGPCPSHRISYQPVQAVL